MIAVGFFATAALLALFGLCAVALHDVPRISGTVALVLTFAALGVAILR
ncbi:MULTISPECIES: hypothetical protein [unclassified Streptomyces]